MKTFEIEIIGATARTYFINAESAEKAEKIAWEEMDTDCDIPSAWKQNSEISYVEEVEELPQPDSELDKLNQDL